MLLTFGANVDFTTLNLNGKRPTKVMIPMSFHAHSMTLAICNQFANESYMGGYQWVFCPISAETAGAIKTPSEKSFRKDQVGRLSQFPALIQMVPDFFIAESVYSAPKVLFCPLLDDSR